MIRLAENKDINQIMEIIKIIREEMIRYQNYQWDDTYPRKDDFIKDIYNKELYVYESDDGNVGGFICVNFNEAKEYMTLNWSSNDKALVIHRMAVSSKYRGQGVAVKLMKYAEELGKKMNIGYIHTDTYSTNKAMNTLLKKLKYEFVGVINMMGKPLDFNCYERRINY